MDSPGHSAHRDELDEMLSAYAAWEASADAMYAKFLAGQVLNTLRPDQLDQDYARSRALYRDWIKTVVPTADRVPQKPVSG